VPVPGNEEDEGQPAVVQQTIDPSFLPLIDGLCLQVRSRTFWMCLFPEGTRISRSKIEASREFSRGRGIPMLERVLTPRSKGMSATLVALRGSVDSVLDVTLGYVGGDPQVNPKP
jgi:hypothetical protein